jgi:hypothetical protein
METTKYCPECGADWTNDQPCIEQFYMMGSWELEYLLYDVHNLMVLCYYLQHPSLYSPEGLRDSIRILRMFMEEGQTIQQVRQRIGKGVDSGNRKYKIKGTLDSFGSYANPIQWTMTAADVIHAGMDNYYESVRAWADSVLKSLRESNNLE